MAIAPHAAPEGWIARDKDGKSPLSKATMMRSLKRAIHCAQNAQLDKILPDNEGNTLLMQTIDAFSSKDGFGLGAGIASLRPLRVK